MWTVHALTEQTENHGKGRLYMYLYNTLSREKNEFIPLDPQKKHVSMYTCGMTVYSFTHIGHLRAYLTSDILKKYLEFQGYQVKQVMNITDVGHMQSDADEGEDKLEVKAKQENTTPWSISRHYEKMFLQNLEEFQIGRPTVIARATEHVDEMIKIIKGLEEKGYAYRTDVGLIYDTAKFASYADFARLKLEDQMGGARVTVDPQRKSQWDFALWITNKPNHIMKWDSPWGVGYPGWHIECSAMCHKYLGEQVDIHTGGVDHIPIHHTNEIAQSEAYSGKKFVDYWVHTEFLKVDGTKMSKSLGNLYTLDDLKEAGYSPLSLRYMFLKSDYRKPLDFRWSTLHNAQNELVKIWEFFAKHPLYNGKVLDKYVDQFKAAMDDSLNMPMAVDALWALINSGEKADDIIETALVLDEVLGLDLRNASYNLSLLEDYQGIDPQKKQEASLLLRQRREARQAKNYAEADRIRDAIGEMGFAIQDSSQGSKIVLKQYGKREND